MQRTEVAASAASRQGRRVASRAADEGQDVAATVRGQVEHVGARARQRSSHVARATAGDARGLVDQVRNEASGVLEEASWQARRAVDDTKVALQGQAATQLGRLGDRIRQLSDEAMALADGNPQAAVTLRDFVTDTAGRLADAADRVSSFGSDLETRGLSAALSDLQSFARRRPGLFLLGALGGGFVAGRMARSAGADDEGDDAYDEYEDEDRYAGNGNGHRRAAGTRRVR